METPNFSNMIVPSPAPSSPEASQAPDDPETTTNEEGSPQKKSKKDPNNNARTLALNLLDSEWKLAAGATITSEVDHAMFVRNARSPQTGLEAIRRFISDDIWTMLVTCVNHNLAKGQSATAKVRARIGKLVDVEELMKFYGTMILVESTWGNDNTKIGDHLKSINSQYGSVKGLGVDRFCAIRRNFYPTLCNASGIRSMLPTSHEYISDHDPGSVRTDGRNPDGIPEPIIVGWPIQGRDIVRSRN